MSGRLRYIWKATVLIMPLLHAVSNFTVRLSGRLSGLGIALTTLLADPNRFADNRQLLEAGGMP
jgi:hypothetical protein